MLVEHCSSVGEMKRIKEFFPRRPRENKAKFRRSLNENDRDHSALVLTLMNIKVKADKDYNLSYLMSFLKINKKK